MPHLHLMVWLLWWQILAVEGEIQGQPGGSRDSHIPGRPTAPGLFHLCTGHRITRGELRLILAASSLKGHCARVFFSAVRAPLTCALISKHRGLLREDSSQQMCLYVMTVCIRRVLVGLSNVSTLNLAFLSSTGRHRAGAGS